MSELPDKSAENEPGGEHSPDSRYGLKINGGISPGFENLISRLAVIEDDKDTPIFGDTTPPSSSIPRADQITHPYDSQPRLPFFLPRQSQFMSLPSSIYRPVHGGNRFLRGDYRDGDTRRRLGGDGRPMQRRRAKSYSKVEKELLDRAKEKGVDRTTARQTLKDKLAWREGNNTEQVVQKRWLLIVISDEYIDDMEAGKETRHRIVCYAIDNTKIIEEKRFADKEPKFDYPGISAYRFNPRSPEETDSMFVHMSKFLQNSWDNLILVPADQFKQITTALHWIKQRRDAYNRRDTASIRLDRLICLEDVISVFREVNDKVLFDLEDDEEWDRLQHLRVSDTVIYGRATCHYFTTALLKSCIKDPNAMAEEPNSVVKVLRIPPPLSESLKFADDRIAAYCNNKSTLEQPEEPQPLVQSSSPLEATAEQSEHSITDESTLVDASSECVGSASPRIEEQESESEAEHEICNENGNGIDEQDTWENDNVHKTYVNPMRRSRFNPRRQPTLAHQRRKMPPSLINQVIEPPPGIKTNFDSPGYEYEKSSKTAYEDPSPIVRPIKSPSPSTTMSNRYWDQQYTYEQQNHTLTQHHQQSAGMDMPQYAYEQSTYHHQQQYYASQQTQMALSSATNSSIHAHYGSSMQQSKLPSLMHSLYPVPLGSSTPSKPYLPNCPNNPFSRTAYKSGSCE